MTIILRALITIMSLLGIVPATAIGADPPTAPPPPVRRPSGITSETEQAINRGLAYLVRRQDHQGSWANRDGHGEYTVAMTALAGLALVMDGNTTTQGRYAPQVDRATKFLLDSAGSNGLISRGKYDSRPMYGHGFAMLFFGQVYGMTEDAARAREIHHALSGGVNLIARAQSRLGGWYYTSDSGNDEGSVTVTQIQALRSCRNAGVAVPKTVIDTAMDYLAQSQNEDGGIRYMVSQRSGASRPAITAAAVCCWYNAGQYDTPRSRRALDFCKDRIPLRTALGNYDYYAHLYLAQALFIGADPDWDGYYAQRRDFLLGEQQADGSWWGDGVGDVYGTATALIILQIPYNRLPIMQR